MVFSSISLNLKKYNMHNKKLEERLRKIGQVSCIPILEMCEIDKTIREIQVDIAGFTNSGVVNRMIEVYLDTLKIKIKYVKMQDKLNQLKKKNLGNEEIKNECKNVIHQPFKHNITKQQKKQMFTNYKYSMFSIEGDSYVTCPDCQLFEKL